MASVNILNSVWRLRPFRRREPMFPTSEALQEENLRNLNQNGATGRVAKGNTPRLMSDDSGYTQSRFDEYLEKRRPIDRAVQLATAVKDGYEEALKLLPDDVKERFSIPQEVASLQRKLGGLLYLAADKGQYKFPSDVTDNQRLEAKKGRYHWLLRRFDFWRGANQVAKDQARFIMDLVRNPEFLSVAKRAQDVKHFEGTKDRDSDWAYYWGIAALRQLSILDVLRNEPLEHNVEEPSPVFQGSKPIDQLKVHVDQMYESRQKHIKAFFTQKAKKFALPAGIAAAGIAAAGIAAAALLLNPMGGNDDANLASAPVCDLQPAKVFNIAANPDLSSAKEIVYTAKTALSDAAQMRADVDNAYGKMWGSDKDWNAAMADMQKILDVVPADAEAVLEQDRARLKMAFMTYHRGDEAAAIALVSQISQENFAKVSYIYKEMKPEWLAFVGTAVPDYEAMRKPAVKLTPKGKHSHNIDVGGKTLKISPAGGSYALKMTHTPEEANDVTACAKYFRVVVHETPGFTATEKEKAALIKFAKDKGLSFRLAADHVDSCSGLNEVEEAKCYFDAYLAYADEQARSGALTKDDKKQVKILRDMRQRLDTALALGGSANKEVDGIEALPSYEN